MDKIDIKILNELQKDASIKNHELAEAVALSPSPCARRVQQLENEGYIKQYVALLNPDHVGLNIMVFVLVALEDHDPETMQHFQQQVLKYPEIIECHMITGHSADYLLKVMVPSLQNYRDFLLQKLTAIKGVDNVHSSFVLDSVRNSTQLPLKHLHKEVF